MRKYQVEILVRDFEKDEPTELSVYADGNSVYTAIGSAISLVFSHYDPKQEYGAHSVKERPIN